jgi:hypothetical protein
MKGKVAILKSITAALGVIILGSVQVCAQNTPTLALAAGKAGISSAEAGRASNFRFQMEASGWPRAVTAGETIFMTGSWPNGNNPTITDDKSNSWTSAISCNDSTNTNHGFFYAINAAANTSMITETHSSAIGNGVFDWAHFYNMSTTSSGFVDGSSCRTGVKRHGIHDRGKGRPDSDLCLCRAESAGGSELYFVHYLACWVHGAERRYDLRSCLRL